MADRRSDDALQDIVWQALAAVAPERAAELDRIRTTYGPLFHILEDTLPDGNIVMEGGVYKFVRFNHRTMRLFWLASFMQWAAYESLANYANSGKTETDAFDELYRCFEETRTSSDVDSVDWPSHVPPPGHLVEHVTGKPARVAGELSIFSVCWAFLHELRHLMHQQDGTAADPSDLEACRREELSCDSFATEFFLGRVQAYSAETGQDLDTLHMKRQAGIYAALFAIALIAGKEWGASNLHPALQARIEGTVHEIQRFHFNLVAVGMSGAAFTTLQLRYPHAPSPLLVRSVAEAFTKWAETNEIEIPER